MLLENNLLYCLSGNALALLPKTDFVPVTKGHVIVALLAWHQI
jgi:hypothetical protein